MQDELMDGQMNIVPPWFLHEISGTKANTMELDLNKRYEKVESLAIIRKKIPSLSFDTYYSLFFYILIYRCVLISRYWRVTMSDALFLC